MARVNTAVINESYKAIVKKFDDVLGDAIGCLPGEYDIKIDNTVAPVVHPPRSVPAAIRQQVKDELEHLEKCGIIARVTEPTQWVSSMVVVKKKNGRVRICIDPYDLNKAILRELHPMSSIEDIATRQEGSTVFSTLDANSGYYQIKLSKKCSLLSVFNTLFGRYRYLRMPMGEKCSAEVFQREMSMAMGDIDGVEIAVDDIQVHAKTQSEHDSRLIKVLERSRQLNLKLNREKSRFALIEVDYVGHRLTREGLVPQRNG